MSVGFLASGYCRRIIFISTLLCTNKDVLEVIEVSRNMQRGKQDFLKLSLLAIEQFYFAGRQGSM